MKAQGLADKLNRVFGAHEEEKIKDYSETRDKAKKDEDKDEAKKEDMICNKDTKSKDEEKE